MQEQGCNAPTWSLAVYWMHRLCSILDGADQGHPPPVSCLGPPYMGYKAIWDGCYLCEDSQAKPNYESRLVVASAMPRDT